MASWVLVPCLVTCRDEFNRLSPGRDRGSDGSIGDSAHSSSSDHTPDEQSRILEDHDADTKNEVHALDIDSSGPWPGTGTQKERFHARIMRIIAGEKRKWLDPNDRCRLNYVIWDGKVYDKDRDFVPYKHTGPDPHTGHAHLSSRYETSCENDTRPWGVYPEKEITVAAELWDDMIKVTGTTGRELFEPDRPEGTEVAASTILQLAAIWARRAQVVAAENSATLAEVKATLARIEAMVTPDE